jgi:hypothetical protein
MYTRKRKRRGKERVGTHGIIDAGGVHEQRIINGGQRIEYDMGNDSDS